MSGNEFRFWLCVCKHGVDGLGFKGSVVVCIGWWVEVNISGTYLLERVNISFT